jgi:hypothetical protein
VFTLVLNNYFVTLGKKCIAINTPAPVHHNSLALPGVDLRGRSQLIHRFPSILMRMIRNYIPFPGKCNLPSKNLWAAGAGLKTVETLMLPASFAYMIRTSACAVAKLAE